MLNLQQNGDYKFLKLNFLPGFTLIETMLSTLIFFIIFITIFSIYTSGVLFWQQGLVESEVGESLRIGMDRLSRELRQASRLCNLGNNTIRFYDSEDRLITYFIYNKNQLNRKIEGNYYSAPVVNNVVGLNAHYNEYNHLITVTLTGRNKHVGPLSISTSLCLRSLTDS